MCVYYRYHALIRAIVCMRESHVSRYIDGASEVYIVHESLMVILSRWQYFVLRL